MQTPSEVSPVNLKLERTANLLRFIGWGSLGLQVGLGAASLLMLIFAISSRSFSQAITPTPGVQGVPGTVVPNYNQGTTPGSGVSVFWAVCGILTLLFSLYLAFRLTRYARRLRISSPELHPKKAELIQLLRISAIAGFVGMLLFIIGGGVSLAILLAKSIAQPQGVAIYDPNRIIRPLDIFVAAANMSGIAAHFIGTVASLGLFNWLHPSDAKS